MSTTFIISEIILSHNRRKGIIHVIKLNSFIKVLDNGLKNPLQTSTEKETKYEKYGEIQ
jgi:hypothetical protein